MARLLYSAPAAAYRPYGRTGRHVDLALGDHSTDDPIAQAVAPRLLRLTEANLQLVAEEQCARAVE